MQHLDGKVSASNPAGAREAAHSEAARRALAEAEERRRLAGQEEEAVAREKAAARKEINGRSGLDPARYGDWEVKGIASDF
jgi:hypothetical protein